MTALGITVAVLLLLWCLLLYVPFRWRPVGRYLFAFKTPAVACVPFIAVTALALTGVAAAFGEWWVAVPAAVAAVGAIVVIIRVGRAGVDGWWTGPLPNGPEPRLRQDVPFATVPGTDRVLLCDVWQPGVGAVPSGVAVVYLHGSGYVVFDKDFGTRPLFRQLAGQGHVIVDVAYRLYPEADLPGMVADALRAVEWVRRHAAELGVDPDRIVLAGGSSGGHQALLAAYGHDAPVFAPPELAGSDLRVQGVVSMYGQVGLDTMARHTGEHKSAVLSNPHPDWTAQPSRMMVRLFGKNAARLRLQFVPFGGSSVLLTGGTPSTVPEKYAEVSALSYVDAGCPPTLLIHGTHDEMAPVSATRNLQAHLERVGVPVTAVYLPHTDHMFDILMARWSPAAQVGIRTLERFLVAVRESQQRAVAQV